MNAQAVSLITDALFAYWIGEDIMAQLQEGRQSMAVNFQDIITKICKEIKKNKHLYIISLPIIAYYVIFHYAPMYGIIIAFKNYNPGKGFLESHWVGLSHFEKFFKSVYFFRVLKNTLIINFLQLIFGFPAPILLALLLNELKNEPFKRLTQTITYIPHFISLIVVCGMIVDFVSKNGIVNDIIAFFGGEKASLLMKEEYYRPIYIISGIWQGAGWGSIVYLAALTRINIELYEAAIIDNAGRWKQFVHITAPGIMPTIIIMLILNIGNMLSEGPEKTLLLYNPANYEVSDIISTFVYRIGLVDNNFSYSTAVGLFNSVVNFTLLVLANKVSRKVSESSLW